MLLYLIRHGESLFNAEQRIQGQLDTQLSPLGIRQSQAIAESFRGKPIAAVYCSPLARARGTAEPLARLLGVELRTDEQLKEINAGVFQGHVWSEIFAQWPEAAAAWKAQDPDFRIPGGESRRDLMTRGRAALESIRETGLPQVAVVAHGGVLTAALKALLEIPAGRNPFLLYNGSISMAEWNQQFKLITLNQMEHLTIGGDDLRTRTGEL
ncbi:MAG TPA: histidine phosphatase family protein [Pirellulales bacterium]|jgi:probable phosphoglycerate mutase|nr:histidine phosphatase family protein [Pirellulales bacterium]